MEKLDKDIRTYLDAVTFAHYAHAHQRYGDAPYTRHLAHVENVLARFGFSDSNLLAAAWLHDSIEDGHTSEGVIKEQFGVEVGRLVACVTDGEGRNRKERKAASYAKMRAYPESIPLKLADRIANMETCLLDGDEGLEGLLSMYRKEYAGFREQLHHVSLTVGSTHNRVHRMWAYLDGLIVPDPRA